MERLEFLAALHRDLRPRNYLEIGVQSGVSLALSHVPSIGVDPAFQVRTELRADVQLVRATSDAFFARAEPLRHLRGGRNPWRNLRHNRPLLGRLGPRATVDLAYIDGMHLFEFALRDFMNVERHASATTVVVLDDMLPRNVEEAARDRTTSDWAGDVYKLIGVLREHRPDLLVIPVDTQPTGVLVVLGLDPGNTVLKDRYDRIMGDQVVPDPQPVPAWILERRGAVNPASLLGTGVWRGLARMRRWHVPRSRVRAALRREVAPLLAAASPPPTAGVGPS